MDAIIAGGVVPAAIHIDEMALNVGDREVPVSAIEISARALAFEGIEDIRQCAALEQVVADLEAQELTTGSPIDGHARTVLATVPAGRNPYAISIDSDQNAVYVANFGSPAYTRLNLASLRH